MEYCRYRIEYKSRSDVFKLYCLGDIHAGVVYCAEKRLKAKINQIKDDPFALFVGMGDYCDCITPHDKRFDTSGLADWVKKDNIIESQRRWIVDILNPIRHKCIGLLEGNHEVSIRLFHSDDIYSNICDDLGVTPLGYSCFLDLIFIRNPQNAGRDVTRFRGRLEHGSGWAQTDGAKLNRLKKGLRGFDADFYAMGHLHDIKVDVSSPLLTVNRAGKIVSKVRVAAMTGCWFKTYEQGQRPSYGEQRGFDPTPIGCPVFLMRPDTQQIEVLGGDELLKKTS